MRGSLCRTRSLDPVAASAEAVDGEIADDDVAGIDDLDGTVSELAVNHRTRARLRAGHGYATTGGAFEVGDGQ